MLNKKCFGAVLLAAAAVSSTAMAQDRGANTVIGALAGAAIGGSVGGRDSALVGAAIGAAVGNSVRTDDDYYRSRGYSYNSYPSGYSSGYYQPAPAAVYVESRPRYYYEPRPVYVESRPYYDRDRYYDRGGRHYDRGWDRGHDRGGWDRHR
ncbi:hypothetical protein AB595_04620 [Massilia sp. WF1]|nr:hypothetical protein AM586_12520 [Massilia sp. WG5]KLU37912.1 hypothetical protein AB595_04620 [Massilia sp. WF1]